MNNTFSNEALQELFKDFHIGAPVTPQVTSTPIGTTEKTVVSSPVPQTQSVQPQIQPANNATDMSMLLSAQAHMQQIESELNTSFVERNKLIKLMMLAITTGTNMLMLGPPGTAKSKITHELCNRIEGGNYFQWMLNKTSDPSEILGSYSIKEMENDKFIRVTKGKLPEAHIVFLDEVYKSNAPTLNALLTIMNEKVFYNDGKAVPIPLVSLFGASNEAPEDDSLNALHDRFILRMNLEYVHDASNKKRMFNNYIDERAGLTNLVNKTKITFEEIKALQEATRKITISKDIISSFIKVISELNNQAIFISDRRQNECFKIMQGSAVLAGRKYVILDDMQPLIYVLWEREEDIPTIEDTITKIINPYDDKFKEYVDEFNKIKNSIENAQDDKEKYKLSIQYRSKVEKLVTRLNALINKASKEHRDVSKFAEFRDSITEYQNQLLTEALGGSRFGDTLDNTADKSVLTDDTNVVF